MKKFNQITLIACGLFIMLAALPVLAQNDNAAQINKRPLRDFADSLNQKIEGKKVDLTKPFLVELEGVLNKDGKLDPKKSKFIKSEGDAAMGDVGKTFIEAISDSGLLYFLKSMGIGNINLTVAQDETTFRGFIASELLTAEKAGTMASSFNGLFALARMGAKEEQIRTLMDNFRAATNGKKVLINFVAPRETVHELIKKNLEKPTTKPSGE